MDSSFNFFSYLEDEVNKILSKAQILLVLLSHELLAMLHVTHQFTYFIYSSSQDKLKNSRIKKIQQVLAKLSNQQN